MRIKAVVAKFFILSNRNITLNRYFKVFPSNWRLRKSVILCKNTKEMRNFEQYSACLLSGIKDKRLKKTF